MIVFPKKTKFLNKEYNMGVLNDSEVETNEYIEKCTNHYIKIPNLEISGKTLKVSENFTHSFEKKQYEFEKGLIVDISIFEYLLLQDKKKHFIEIKITTQESVENISDEEEKQEQTTQESVEIKKTRKRNLNKTENGNTNI